MEHVVTADGGALDAVLLQLGQHAERLGSLDERESEHHRTLRASLADVHVRLTALRGMLRTQARALESLRGLEQAVADLAGRLSGQPPTGGGSGPAYVPIPVTAWWTLRGEEREEALARLRSWAATIYRPLYGHLAAQLGDCWEAHPLALVTLDWLAELWNILYLNPARDARDLAAQAELGTRILPAATALLAAETRDCHQHTRTALRGVRP